MGSAADPVQPYLLSLYHQIMNIIIQTNENLLHCAVLKGHFISSILWVNRNLGHVLLKLFQLLDWPYGMVWFPQAVKSTLSIDIFKTQLRIHLYANHDNTPTSSGPHKYTMYTTAFPFFALNVFLWSLWPMIIVCNHALWMKLTWLDVHHHTGSQWTHFMPRQYVSLLTHL